MSRPRTTQPGTRPRTTQPGTRPRTTNVLALRGEVTRCGRSGAAVYASARENRVAQLSYAIYVCVHFLWNVELHFDFAHFFLLRFSQPN